MSLKGLAAELGVVVLYHLKLHIANFESKQLGHVSYCRRQSTEVPLAYLESADDIRF